MYAVFVPGPLHVPGASREGGSPWLPLSVAVGAVGELLGAAFAGLLALFESFDPVHERLLSVLTVVALGCAAAFVVGIAYRRTDSRAQLVVHLSASLYLLVGLYAVGLERGDVELALDAFAFLLLVPLVPCGIAAMVAGAIVVRRRGSSWRYVLAPIGLALAMAVVPLGAAVSGDPGDAAEAAVRRQVGAGALVTCSSWEDVRPGTVYCAIEARRSWGAEDCVITMRRDGSIRHAESAWGTSKNDRCRSLETASKR